MPHRRDVRVNAVRHINSRATNAKYSIILMKPRFT
jgi:hypothetical protein